jgi:hypothetical protein
MIRLMRVFPIATIVLVNCDDRTGRDWLCWLVELCPKLNRVPADIDRSTAGDHGHRAGFEGGQLVDRLDRAAVISGRSSHHDPDGVEHLLFRRARRVHRASRAGNEGAERERRDASGYKHPRIAVLGARSFRCARFCRNDPGNGL